MKNKITKQSVTKDSNIADVVFRYPKVAEILMEYGLHCVGCVANTLDTIESGAQLHGIEKDEIEEMVEKANALIGQDQ